MRKYRLYSEDATEKDIFAPDLAAATKKLEAWLRGGEWGEEGARVTGEVTRLRGDRLIEDESATVTVEIEPDHITLMRRAGASDCDHEWSSEGEEGCWENPGVWSGGGTSIISSVHCIHCGLKRVDRTTGPQHNRYEHDTVEYRMPNSAELAEMRAKGMVESPDAE